MRKSAALFFFGYIVLSLVALWLVWRENRELYHVKETAEYLIRETNRLTRTEWRETPALGPERAPISIIVFVNFNCPYCGSAMERVRALQAQQPDRIRLVFRYLPRAGDDDIALRASLAAWRQDRFWEMQAYLFANDEHRGSEPFVFDAARRLGLDQDRFQADYASGDDILFLEKSHAEAKMLGIVESPTFIVNGLRVGGLDESSWQRILRMLPPE